MGALNFFTFASILILTFVPHTETRTIGEQNVEHAVNRRLCKPVLACAIACDNGLAVDEDGCTLCSCNPSLFPVLRLCDLGWACAIYCQSGQRVDENGCTLCSCNPDPLQVIFQ